MKDVVPRGSSRKKKKIINGVPINFTLDGRVVLHHNWYLYYNKSSRVLKEVECIYIEIWATYRCGRERRLSGILGGKIRQRYSKLIKSMKYIHFSTS